MNTLTPDPGPPAQARPVQEPRVRGLDQRPYFYLLYLLFYFTNWFFLAPTPTDIAVGIGSAVVFGAVYIFAMGRETPIILAAAVFALALSLGLTPFNGMSGTYAIYAVTLCGGIRPARQALVAMGVAGVVYISGSLLIVLAPLAIFISPFEIAITSFISVMAGLATWSGFNNSERTDLRERRLRLDAELAAARERERIARDLHDVLGHTLTTIAVKSDLAARLLGADDGAARREIEEIRDASRATLKEVRAAVAGMHRTSIDVELERTRVALRSVDIAMSVSGKVPTLASQHASALGMALREATTNILRHSNARTVEITLETDGSRIELTVEDDGNGDTPEPGGGLAGMRGRLETLGGSLEITKGAKGVRLVMRLPLKPALEAT